MSTPEESTGEEPEGIQSLRNAYEGTRSELDTLRKELAVTKLGVTPNEDQMAALDAVLGGDWADTETVSQKYTALFGSQTPSAQPQETEVIEEAAPTGGDMLDHVTSATSGLTTPPGEEIPVDPVTQGYNEYRNDLNAGRPRQDASAQVLNRLIDRGAKDMPGGVYDHDEYQSRLDEGRTFLPPEVRTVG